MNTDKITLRPINDDDTPLLYQIYASTRADELKMVSFWSDAQKEAFTQQQFSAQSLHYFSVHYAYREYSIILFEGKPAGRLFLDCAPGEIRVVDIALLPEFRGLGIGEYLLREVLDRAARNGDLVVIHVERMNRAKQLYERVGFKVVEAVSDIYLRMECRPILSENEKEVLSTREE